VGDLLAERSNALKFLHVAPMENSYARLPEKT